MLPLASLAFLLAAAPAAAPAPAPWYQSWEGIRAAASSVRTIEASFVQTRTLRILRKPLVSRGVMAYRRPNDLRWEYQSPLATLLLVRDGAIQRLIKHEGRWVPDASAKLEAMKVVIAEINLWLDGNFAASRTFRPELRSATRTEPAHVLLVPVDKALGKLVSRIAIRFGERPGTVAAIDIHEEGAGVTHIVFENPRYGEDIPDARFEPPK